jgi:5-methylcytosine-specific restriction protein A
MFIRFKTVRRHGVGDTYAYLCESKWIKKLNTPRQRVVAYLGKIKDFERVITKQVYDKCNNQCVLCGSVVNLSIDHIIPLSKNGVNNISNLQILCMRCNQKKGKKKQSSLFGEVI